MRGVPRCQVKVSYQCNETKTSRTTRWRSPRSPQRRHHQNLWQAKTTFRQDKMYCLSPFKLATVGSLPAYVLGEEAEATISIG